MDKKTKICLSITILLLAAAIFLCIKIYTYRADVRSALIYQDGILIEEIDLTKVTEPYELVIEGTDNASNIIEVRPGEIAVIQATCPDKLCVKTGFVKNDLLPITCLPNHLVIKIQTEQTNSSLDAIAY